MLFSRPPIPAITKCLWCDVGSKKITHTLHSSTIIQPKSGTAHFPGPTWQIKVAALALSYLFVRPHPCRDAAATRLKVRSRNAKNGREQKHCLVETVMLPHRAKAGAQAHLHCSPINGSMLASCYCNSPVYLKLRNYDTEPMLI